MKTLRYTAFAILIGFASASDYPKKPPVYQKSDLLGDFEPDQHPDFDRVRRKYANRSNHYLREEVYDAFKAMWRAAQDDDLELQIVSSTRNRPYQNGIWNRKWQALSEEPHERALQILRYSSMPGTSRHHWGTDLDLNALNNAYFESGEGLKVYQWLQANAARFGFYQPYTAYDTYRDAGYREEKWHWSYFPLADRFLRAYPDWVDYEDLRDFQGSERAKELSVIERYVMGVAPSPAHLSHRN